MWLRVDDEIFDNPKFLALEDMPHYDTTIMVWLRICVMSARLESDGFLPLIRLIKDIPIGAKATRAALKRLADVGLIAISKRSITIHDFCDYNPSHAELKKTRADSAQRMQKTRDLRAGKERIDRESTLESIAQSTLESTDSKNDIPTKSITYEKCCSAISSAPDPVMSFKTDSQSDVIEEVEKPEQHTEGGMLMELVDPYTTSGDYATYCKNKGETVIDKEKLDAIVTPLLPIPAAELAAASALMTGSISNRPVYRARIVDNKRKEIGGQWYMEKQPKLRGSQPASPQPQSRKSESMDEYLARVESERKALRDGCSSDATAQEEFANIKKSMGW